MQYSNITFRNGSWIGVQAGTWETRVELFEGWVVMVALMLLCYLCDDFNSGCQSEASFCLFINCLNSCVTQKCASYSFCMCFCPSMGLWCLSVSRQWEHCKFRQSLGIIQYVYLCCHYYWRVIEALFNCSHEKMIHGVHKWKSWLNPIDTDLIATSTVIITTYLSQLKPNIQW